MNLTIVGTGYVGLVTGACLADIGHDVFCLDVDQRKIDVLNNGGVPIHEPGLLEIIARNRKAGRLKFSTDIEAAVAHGDIQFIAVGTPPDEDGSADLRHVLSVADTIGKHMACETVIVTKSTVPVGTAAKVRDAVSVHARYPFHVVSNPEFLKEGAAIDDFMKPDRVVIGADSDHARSIMAELYAPFVRTGKPIIFMDLPSAELTKYAANAMLATRISFMNDIANLCECVGANVDDVRKGIGSDLRIGPAFLFPGPGYGGSCFPKDVKALCRTAGENAYPLRILDAVESVNEDQKRRLFHKLQRALGEQLDGARVAVWGLAFKPNTDDMREAPSLVLIEELVNAGAHVVAHDPVAMDEAKRRIGNGTASKVTYAPSNYDALDGADALVVVTDWNQYRHPDFPRIKKTLKRPIVVDGRNLYSVSRMKELGFQYYSIGRGRQALD
jgi:UDPglucose 6-dehydrogenase